MARLVVAAAAGIVAGIVTENPVTGFQVFGLVPGYGPPGVKPHAVAEDGVKPETSTAEQRVEDDDS